MVFAAEAGDVGLELLGVADELAVLVVVAAALEAARRLRHRLFGGKPLRDLAEVGAALGGRTDRGAFARLLLVGGEVDALRVARGDDAEPALEGAAGEMRGDGLGGLLGLGDRLDGDAGAAVHGVAAGEHRREAGGFVLERGAVGAVGGDGAALGGDKRLEAGGVVLLADGHDDHVELEVLELALYRHRAAAALLVRLAELHHLQLEPGDAAAGDGDLGRVAQEHEGNALLLGLDDLHLLGGHLGAGAAVDDVDGLGAEPDGGAAGVHRGVAAADDGDGAAVEPRLLAQEVDAAEDALGVLARYAHRRGAPGTVGDDERIAVAPEVGERGVAPDLEVVHELDAHRSDEVGLGLEDGLRQAVLGDAVAEHAAHLGHLVDDLHLRAAAGELVGAGKSGGAAADDGHALAGERGLVDRRRRRRLAAAAGLVGRESLERGDGDRRLHLAAAALALAGMGTDPTDRGRQREGLHHRRRGVGEAPFGDLADVLLAVGVGGVLDLAGTEAVAVVVAHQELERELPRLEGALALRVHHHAFAHLGGAGPEELRAALGLHHADAAGAVGGESLEEAEVGDLDPGLLRRREHGGARRHAD